MSYVPLISYPRRLANLAATDPDHLAITDEFRSVTRAELETLASDTAEAFVGDSVVRVFGSIDVGVSLGESEIRGRRLRVAMKPGGYGSSNTLVDLVNG